MRMRSEYVREQKRYTQKDLSNLFQFNSEDTVSFIKKLKAYGVLKMVKATAKQRDLTDLVDEDVEIIDVGTQTEDYYYVFTFVGVLTIGNRILKCFPKYLLNEEKPLDLMKQVLKVISKYNSKEQIINLYNGDAEQNSFNMLAVVLYLLNDYNENGVYTNQQNIIETNGEGEILWDNTINETFAIISNNRPFYIELQTQNTIDDDMDYFKRLHQCILTECSQKLKDADLIDLFEMEEILLTEEKLSDFGDADFILYRLHKELNVQFMTRKQRVLKTLYAYVAHTKTFEDSFGISMYGTNSFNLVWEGVCAEVFGNRLNVAIEKLKLPVTLHKDYQEQKKKTLLDIIDKPMWRYFAEDESQHDNSAKDTLIPDLISLYEKEDGMCFGIFDAKYYNIKLEKSRIEGQPGIGDVTKQYLYQLAYNSFILKHGFSSIQNAFLMPAEDDNALLNGEVEMGILKGLSNPPLQNVLVVKLPASKMYHWYLTGNIIDIYKEFEFL